MVRQGARGVTDASHLAAAIALLSYWIQTTLLGFPFNEIVHSVPCNF